MYEPDHNTGMYQYHRPHHRHVERPVRHRSKPTTVCVQQGLPEYPVEDIYNGRSEPMSERK